MPNWCSVSYTFYADADEGKTNLRQLHGQMRNMYLDSQYAGFAELLARCEVDSSVIEKIHIDSRDSIRSVDENTSCFNGLLAFTMQADTAWSNYYANRVLYYLVTHIFKGVHIAYIADECGSDYYVKYDPIGCYPDRYIVEITGNDAPSVDTWYLEEKKDIFTYVKELGIEGLDENSTLSEMRENIKGKLVSQAIGRGIENPDINVFINEYEEYTFDDCDVEELEGI